MPTIRYGCVLLTCVFSLAVASPAVAAELFSNVFIGAGSFNGVDGFDFGQSTTGAPVGLAASQDYFFDDGENFETTTFSGQATASAQFGRLRTSASGSITNGQVPIESYEVGGYPEVFLVDSIAQSTETLQYGGTAVNYTSTYVFRLTGFNGGEDSFGVLRVKQADDFEEQFLFFDRGPINEIIRTSAFVHGATPQEVTITLNSQYQPLSDFFTPGDNYSGSADFGSTLELIGIDLRDDNGVLLPQDTITSSSGVVIPIVDAATIPEPSSLLLVFTGLVATTVASRRR